MSAPVDVLAVTIFGDQRNARVTKNRCNWKVSWQGFEIDSFVPRSLAICAREAAMQAARRLESLKWGDRILMASLRGATDSDGAMSTEMAKWIVAKSEGRPFDRHAPLNPGAVVDCARATLLRDQYREPRHV